MGESDLKKRIKFGFVNFNRVVVIGLLAQTILFIPDFIAAINGPLYDDNMVVFTAAWVDSIRILAFLFIGVFACKYNYKKVQSV